MTMYAPTGMSPERECRRRMRNSLRARNDDGGAPGATAFTADLSDRRTSQWAVYRICRSAGGGGEVEVKEAQSGHRWRFWVRTWVTLWSGRQNQVGPRPRRWRASAGIAG